METTEPKMNTYKVVFRRAGTSGKCKECDSEALTYLKIEALTEKEAIKIARRQIVIQVYPNPRLR